MFQVIKIIEKANIIHWGKADDRNCNYGHPKMADVESGKKIRFQKIAKITVTDHNCFER
jgi:hypothetical protein